MAWEGILLAPRGIEIGFIHLVKCFLVKAEIKKTLCDSLSGSQRHVKIIPKAWHFESPCEIGLTFEYIEEKRLTYIYNVLK